MAKRKDIVAERSPIPRQGKTVYLLGAGASAQYNNGATPVPTTKDFIKSARSRFENEFSEVWSFIAEFWPRFWSQNLEKINVEEVLSLIDLGRRRAEGIPPNYSSAKLQLLHEQLLSLVWRTLEHTLRGNPCSLHAQLQGS